MSAAQFYDQNGELRIDGTLVGGGGSQPVTETYAGSNLAVAADTPTPLPWIAGEGTAGLLDLSTPTAPTVVAEGVYAIALYVLQETNAVTPAIWRAALSALCFVTGADTGGERVNEVRGTTLLDDTDFLSACLGLTLTAWMPASGTLGVAVIHEDSAPVTFSIASVYVARLS